MFHNKNLIVGYFLPRSSYRLWDARQLSCAVLSSNNSDLSALICRESYLRINHWTHLLVGNLRIPNFPCSVPQTFVGVIFTPHLTLGGRDCTILAHVTSYHHKYYYRSTKYLSFLHTKYLSFLLCINASAVCAHCNCSTTVSLMAPPESS